MGVFSWFRRRGTGVETGARAFEEQGGGAVALLDPEDGTGHESVEDAQQQALPGVPAARTAPDGMTGPEAALAADGTDAAPAGAVPEQPVPAEQGHQESRPERPDTGDEAMGLMDNLKGKAEELKDKASHLAGQHAEKIDEVVDKAGEAIDKATKGKYSDKITAGAEKAKGAVDDFAEKPEQPGEGGQSSAPGA